MWIKHKYVLMKLASTRLNPYIEFANPKSNFIRRDYTSLIASTLSFKSQVDTLASVTKVDHSTLACARLSIS